MAVLGLRFCARAFSSCSKWGPLFIAVRRPLTIAASLVAEHRLQTRRLSTCGSRAQLLCGMWDPPRPGLEPVCPALAGRLSPTAPPGKPHVFIFKTFLPPKPPFGPWFSLLPLQIPERFLYPGGSIVLVEKRLRLVAWLKEGPGSGSCVYNKHAVLELHYS